MDHGRVGGALRLPNSTGELFIRPWTALLLSSGTPVAGSHRHGFDLSGRALLDALAGSEETVLLCPAPAADLKPAADHRRRY